MSTAPKKKSGTSSFWKTLPGILTAVAGLVTALGGLYAVLSRPPVETPTQPIALRDFVQKGVVERSVYKVREGVHDFSVTVVDVKAKKGILKLTVTPTSGIGANASLQIGRPEKVTVGQHRYSLEVHGFTDLKDGKDVASLTIKAE